MFENFPHATVWVGPISPLPWCWKNNSRKYSNFLWD